MLDSASREKAAPALREKGQRMDSDSDKTPDWQDTPSKYGQEPRARFNIQFDIQDTVRRWWAVVSKPSVATFDAQQQGASWTSVLIQIGILGVLDAIVAVVALRGNVLVNIIGNVVGAYIGFFVIVGLVFGCARLFSGRGALLPLAYTLALIYAPLQIIGTALAFVPSIGVYLLFALSIYQILLFVYATASVNRLSMARAAGAVLVAIVLLFILDQVLASVSGLAPLGL
jgi:hypothetical protein